MAPNPILRIAALATVLGVLAACTYPFDPGTGVTEGRLVIEGDILVGTTSDFTFSYVQPLSGKRADYHPGPLDFSGYIESDDGTVIRPAEGLRPTSDGYGTVLTFDTSDLTADRRYRVHFEADGGREIYESDWTDVRPAPVIDGLSYHKAEAFDELHIALTMHARGSSHFRWTYSEVWEYHSDVSSPYYYNPTLNRVESYKIGEPTLYYCWKSAVSPTINIFSTADQTDDRFEDLSFHRIPLTDNRVQVMYHITVQLEALSGDAYDYWHNIQRNSESQGTIFAPTPSEIAGNIRCLTRPDVHVQGYVNAAVVTQADLYYDNMAEGFYHYPGASATLAPEEPSRAEYAKFHEVGYIPYEGVYAGDSPVPTSYMWGNGNCIDCTRSGGTKQKPEGWPTFHI